MLNFPSRDFTAQYISLSYQSVVQTYTQGTASYFLDGLGNALFFVPTSSVGQQVITADQPVAYADLSGTSSVSILSSFSDTSSYAFEAAFSDTASFAVVSNLAITASFAVTSSYEIQHQISESWASSSLQAIFATQSLYATQSNFATSSISSSFATTASWSVTASYASYASNMGTAISCSWASQSFSASYLSASVATASSIYSNNSIVLDAGYLQLKPTLLTPTTDVSSSYIYVSHSMNTDSGVDLFFNQSGSLVKFKWIVNNLNSGLAYGGKITSSGSNVYVSAGRGMLMNYNTSPTRENNPIISKITWNDITQSITYLTSSQTTFLYIDSFGNLNQQPTNFAPEQYSSSIPLGRLGHADYFNVTSINPLVETTYNQIEQLGIFVRAFGPLKLNGTNIITLGAGLQFGVSSGESYIYGGMYYNTPGFPSEIDTPAIPTASLFRTYKSGSGFYIDNNGGNFYTTIDPTHWDNGSGVLQTVGSGNWTVQRVYFNPLTNRCGVYYGQEIYGTFNNAIAGFSTDTFNESVQTFTSYVLIGFLILRGNTTNLSDTSNNQILQAGVFRNISSTGGSTPTYSLGDLSNVSVASPSQNDLLMYSGSLWINSHNINVSGSLVGTSSYAITASSAQTSSYALTTIANSMKTITSSYTASVSDSTLLCNPKSAMGVNLPSTIGVGTIYNIKNISSFSITVTPASGLIDNQSFQTIQNQYTNMKVQWDGNNWWIL